MDIPGIPINYIEDSFISYKISIKLVNWIKIIAIDILESYALQRSSTINQLESTFDNLAISKRNLSSNLLIIFIKTLQNRKTSVAATFAHGLIIFNDNGIIYATCEKVTIHFLRMFY